MKTELEVARDAYRCSACGASGVRLWRTAHVFADAVELFCLSCGLDREKGRLDDMPLGLARHLDSGRLGYLVGARLDEDGSFWGHTSGPVDEWLALPFANASPQPAQPQPEDDAADE